MVLDRGMIQKEGTFWRCELVWVLGGGGVVRGSWLSWVRGASVEEIELGLGWHSWLSR